MSWFNRNKEDPDRREFREEFNEAIQALNTADKITRMAVGHSINMANSVLFQNFGDIEGFQNTPKPEQMAYLNKLKALEEKLLNEDPASGLGVGLFKMWLATVMENDKELMNLFSKELADLSSEGELPF